MSENNVQATQATDNTPQESNETQEVLNQSAETAQSLENTPKTAEAKKEMERQLKKLKLKVDGKEFEEEFDPNDDEYLTKQLQLAKAAQKRMSEKAQLEKEVANFIDELRKNPRKILTNPDIGIDVKELARSIIEEEIKNSQKTPEQLAKEKLEEELKALKDEREKEKEEFKRKEFERLQEQAYQKYDMAISQALEKKDLPKSPYIVSRIADYMLIGVQNGLDVNPGDVIELVREDMHNDLKDMFAVMPEEVIEKLVGKDVINRIRKKKVASAKAAPPKPVNKAIADTGASNAPASDTPAKKMTIRELFGV